MPADCATVAAVRPDGSIDAGAVNRVLAFRIYKHLAARNTPKVKNFVFSPLALELTLAKLMRALDRSDARRIARTLCLPEPPPASFVKGLEAEIARWKALRADKQPNSKGIDLTLETRAFGTALPGALHGFESESVDPTSKPGGKRIEQWLRTVAGAKARSIVQPIMSPSVVADAVAFEGDLEMPFWNRGRRVPFELDSGITISVAGYENGRVDLRHGDPWANLSMWAYVFPYVAGELNLFFVGAMQPVSRPDFVPFKNLHELEDKLTTDQLCLLDATQTRPDPAWVFFPEFSIHSSMTFGCCGLEWLEQRVGALMQAAALDTRFKTIIPRPKSADYFDDTWPIVRAPLAHPMLVMVRSPTLIVLIGRLADPRHG